MPQPADRLPYHIHIVKSQALDYEKDPSFGISVPRHTALPGPGTSHEHLEDRRHQHPNPCGRPEADKLPPRGWSQPGDAGEDAGRRDSSRSL